MQEEDITSNQEQEKKMKQGLEKKDLDQKYKEEESEGRQKIGDNKNNTELNPGTQKPGIETTIRKKFLKERNSDSDSDS